METKIVVKYCDETPSGQTAIDIFKGAWKSALPPELGLSTGDRVGFYTDPRVHWVKSLLPNGFKGMSVLELGPFEGYDSWLFEQLGAASVLAIEGNNINYLKCLVLKEAIGLRTRFAYGGFLNYLKNSKQQFDIAWASGVLYHSEDPLELLLQLGAKSSRIFLWTHYWSDSLKKTNHYAHFQANKNIKQIQFGEHYELHYRAYPLQQYRDGLPLHYEGGQQIFSYWLTRRDIDRMLAAMGFGSVKVRQDTEYNGMPCVTLYAERTGPARSAEG